ncbi:MAG: hypothetical protein ACKVQT_33885 [Burkholderiales bacterium]
MTDAESEQEQPLEGICAPESKHHGFVVTIDAAIIGFCSYTLDEATVREGFGLTARRSVPVINNLGVLFEHAAFLVRLARTTGAGVSRHQFYARPPESMVDHVRRFSRQQGPESKFSG